MVAVQWASVQRGNNMISNIIVEFCPWHKWVELPGNKELSLHEQKRKYDVERNQHFQMMLWYETREQVKNASK